MENICYTRSKTSSIMKNEEIILVIQQLLENDGIVTASSVQEKIGEVALIQVQKAIRVLLDDGEIRLVEGSNPKEYRKNDLSVRDKVVIKGRNLQKFEFDGMKNLSKGQLVLNVVKKYVRDFNPSYDELKIAFPDSLLKPYGILQQLEVAEEQSKDRKRFFISDPDVIILKDDQKVCVTNQWTSERLESFISNTLKITQYKIMEMK
jgi:hypothetical protein